MMGVSRMSQVEVECTLLNANIRPVGNPGQNTIVKFNSKTSHSICYQSIACNFREK